MTHTHITRKIETLEARKHGLHRARKAVWPLNWEQILMWGGCGFGLGALFSPLYPDAYRYTDRVYLVYIAWILAAIIVLPIMEHKRLSRQIYKIDAELKDLRDVINHPDYR